MPKKNTRKLLLVGNWKMNPSTPTEALSLFKRTRTKAMKASRVQVLVCVPYIYIEAITRASKDDRVLVGAQDVFSEEGLGAFTGAVSADLVAHAGATHSIVGHSERRAFGETNELVRTKIRLALKAGLFVILCVGEKERDTHGKYLSVVKEQLQEALKGVPRADMHKIIVAYEPVWAIGEHALRSATAQDVLEMQIYVRKVLADMVGGDIAREMYILYGGSSDQKNADELLRVGAVDGLLVGRASLNPDVFGEMINIAEKVSKI